MHNLLKTSLLSTLLISTHALANDPIQERWTIDNLHQPESVVIDATDDSVFVSNINGAPAELNGKGYISRISQDGKQLDQYWVEGLDAPKGMAIVGQHLFVADMQTLHMIDIPQGKIVKQFSVPNAKMLNDITAAPDGTVYVSDFLGGTIYRLHNDQLTAWFNSEQIPYPNGLLWDEDRLLIGNWGTEINPDFSTKTPGSLYQFKPNQKSLSVIPTGFELGNLDGIALAGSSLYVSDWISGELFKLNNKERTLLLTLPKGLADIAVAKDTLYTPRMMENKVTAWAITNK